MVFPPTIHDFYLLHRSTFVAHSHFYFHSKKRHALSFAPNLDFLLLLLLRMWLKFLCSYNHHHHASFIYLLLLLHITSWPHVTLLVKVGKILGRRARQSSVAVVLAVERLILGHRVVVLALRCREPGRTHPETAASQFRFK